MVLAMALTPLSTVFSAGAFETWLPSWGVSNRTWVHVVMHDQTGMVRAITVGLSDELDVVTNPGGNRYVLEVGWLGGCSDRQVDLTLSRSGAGYALDERTIGWGCPLDIGLGRSIAIYLWSPIEASAVTFSSSG
jgi:hypothetical protein